MAAAPPAPAPPVPITPLPSPLPEAAAAAAACPEEDATRQRGAGVDGGLPLVRVADEVAVLVPPADGLLLAAEARGILLGTFESP